MKEKNVQKLKCHIVFNRMGREMTCQERDRTAGTGGMETEKGLK